MKAEELVKQWYSENKHPLTWMLRNQTGASIEEVIELVSWLLENPVREIVGRTWEAAIKWEWVENRNQERVDEGSTHWVNPCPDKETFINGVLK
jgi:hypothetical protein